MSEPHHYYTNDPATYECPNGHTVERDDRGREESTWFGTFRGHCSSCEEEWQEFVAEHENDWHAILDDNYPDDPSYFEWRAQRIVDWNRKIGVPERNALPTRDNFCSIVPWKRIDVESGRLGQQRGSGHVSQSDRTDRTPKGGRLVDGGGTDA